LILGLPPMSQYDAGATPMYNAFTARADLTPFKHRPARIDIEARNQPGAPDAQRSAELDFSKGTPRPMWSSMRSSGDPCAAPIPQCPRLCVVPL